MSRTICLLLAGLAVFQAAGCGTKPTSTTVTGTVSLDARPLPDGEIAFVLEGRGPVTLQINNGAFSGEVPVGRNRVEIRHYKPGPPLSTDPTKTPTKINTIPTQFNDKTTLQAEVSAEGPNDFPFALQENPGSAPGR